MKRRRIAGVIAAAFFVSTAAFAQSNSRPSTEQQSQSRVAASDTMTVVGCLMREADYRRAHSLGKGALGGLGLGDEFVLVDVTDVASTGATGSAPSEPSSTQTSPSASSQRCSETGAGKAYRVTGKAEDELKPFVGRRMQITGRFDHERDAKTAAGQTNAKLPAEIRIASYSEAPASTVPPPASASTTPATPPVASAPSQVASNQSSTEKRLPNTASNEPLIALIGLICLMAAIGTRFVRFGVS
jgi:hypothetical protein